MAVAPTQAVPPSAGGNSSSQPEDAADDDRDEETTRSGVFVEQECPGGCLGTAAGAVTAGVVATAISEGHSSKVDPQESSVVGIPLPPPACNPVPTAASSLTSSLPGASCDEPTVTDGNRPPAIPTAMGGESDGDSTSKGGSIANRRRLPEQGPLTFESLSGVELVRGDIFQEAW